jgi:hypothetical protein
MTTTALRSRADVATDAPARYAKQLVAHLGRKVSFSTEGATSTAAFGDTTGQVVVGDGVLTLLVSGPDAEGVTRVEHVLGSHLERFGQRNELTVTWGAERP